MSMSWQQKAWSVIHPLLKDFTGTKPELRKLLNQHYPFGQKKNHPYKVWCVEVNNAIAFKFGAPEPKQQDLALFLQTEENYEEY